MERKRARNRVAASKCRLRKLERISVLDAQAQTLKSDNERLAALAGKLRSEVYALKQELRWHVNNGCKVRDPNNGGVIANPDAESRTTDEVVMAGSQDSPDSTTTASSHTSNSSASSRMPPNKAYLSDCKHQQIGLVRRHPG